MRGRNQNHGGEWQLARGMRKCAPCATAAARKLGWLRPLCESSGSQLLEFALSLPFLVVILVGIIDFGQAYNTKHIMVNASREAARIVVSNPLTDSSCPTGWNGTNSGTPCSVTAAADDVGQYLNNAGMTLGACLSSATPTAAGVSWTYSCNGVALTINKGYVVSGGAGGVVSSTQVTLSYPFTWTFGYVLKLLAPGSSGPTGTQTLTTHVVMQNLVLG